MVDISAPYVTNVSPANGSTSIAVNAPISFDILDVAEPGSLNYTTIDISDYFALDDVSVQADGITTLFNTLGSIPYRPGTLQVFLNGVFIDVVETDPSLGSFTIASPPSAGAVVIAHYENQHLLNNVDLSSVVVKIDGNFVFSGGAWQIGYDGTIEPLDYGYRFTVTVHPAFGFNSTVTVEIGGQDLAEPTPNVLALTLFSTFYTIVPTSFKVPYIANEFPINGSINVVTSSNIDFDIKTDLGTIINLNSINVFLNGEVLVLAGVPQSHPLYTTSSPVLIPQGYHITIQPTSGFLEVQLFRIDMNATDDYNGSTYGADYFEFSTDAFDFILDLTSKLPLPCPYDLTPDPTAVLPPNVNTSIYKSELVSDETYWFSTGIKNLDYIKIPEGTSSGVFIFKEANNKKANTYGKPRDTVTGVVAETYKKRRFSGTSSISLICNSSVTYPLMKLWGDVSSRYLAGYPSLVEFPVPFTRPPYSVYVNNQIGSYFDDFSIKAPTELQVDKQKFLNFKVVSSSVSLSNYDRYYIPFTLETNLDIGLRVLVQVSVQSMDPYSDFYVGLGNNATSPLNDGTNRFGVTFRRVGDAIESITYYGATESLQETTSIGYTDFINKIWLCEIEKTDVGTTKVRLYDFHSDLQNPVMMQEVTGSGTIDASMFTLTSVGNNNAATGANVIGSVYFIDVEKNDTGFPVPYSLGGNVTQVLAKWRPYSNTMSVNLTSPNGLKSLSAECSMYPFGVLSDIRTDYHVFDADQTLTTIDNIRTESNISVLKAEDPSIDDPQSTNANIYRRASCTYQVLNGFAGIVFLSEVYGPTGDNYAIEIANVGPNASLALTVVSFNVLIQLATDFAGNITTTIQDIVNLVETTPNVPLSAVPAGNTSELAEILPQTFLSGGSEYKVSIKPDFDQIALSFRSNKTGSYYVSVNDNKSFQGVGNATIYSDGTFVSSVPLFQPTDIGKTVTISNALYPTNNGVYTINVVLTGSSYPTNTVILDRVGFIEEQGSVSSNPPHFTWKLNTRGYLLTTGFYTRVNTQQPVALLTQDFNNIADGTKTFNVELCKNMLITDSITSVSQAVITTEN